MLNQQYSKRDKDEEILLDYLREPLSRRRFMDFYRLCYNRTLAYLSYLNNKKGYNLSVETKGDGHPFSDLAIDVLGPFLADSPGEPTARILEMLRINGVDSFEKADPNISFNLFEAMLLKSVRQELSRLSNAADPQTANLKRRFKDTLKSKKYIKVDSQISVIKAYALKLHLDRLRENLPPVRSQDLRPLVIEAFNHSLTRAQWCRGIFNGLDNLTDFQNFLVLYRLLREVVIVNSQAVDIYAPVSGYLPRASDDLNSSAVAKAIRTALEYVEMNCLKTFQEKGKLSADEAQNYLESVEGYLIDLIWSPTTAPLPKYFRETMPENEHDLYLKRHKHMFETAIKTARQIFGETLKKLLH